MSHYDSILKEKKVYKESVIEKGQEKKSFPCLLIDVILIFLILIISYFIYYRTFLAPDKLFLMDIKSVLLEYKDVFKGINLDEFNKDYYFDGTLNLDNLEYSYSLIRNKDRRKFNIISNDKSFTYYKSASREFVWLDEELDKIIELDDVSYLSLLDKINSDFFVSIPQDKYIKKFYLDSYIPVVETNLVLDKTNLSFLLDGYSLKDDIEVLFTFKNNAFTSEIINMKVVINNLTTKNRILLTYQDGKITYTDASNLNYGFKLNKKKDDVTLKIYKNEVLFSVLSGMKKEDSYQYTYQIIDKVYNLSLEIKKEDTGYLYLFNSNIENEDLKLEENTAKIVLNYEDSVILDEIDFSKAIKKSLLKEEDSKSFKEDVDKIFVNLREFIDKYKNSIYHVDE